MPPTAVNPASVRIDTRLPGSGNPVRLQASRPFASWTSAPDRLQEDVAAALLRLASDAPDGLLVGVLPYPGKHSPTPTLQRNTLMTFATFEQTDLCLPTPEPTAPERNGFRLLGCFEPDWSAAEYMAGVRRIQDYLAAGDAYQVNLAQRFSAPCQGDPRSAWEALQRRFDPPYAAYVDLGDWQALCLSPESFLTVRDRQVTTRPIKGTRPRGADTATDAALAADLASHPKDQAENLMIVDLLRNDLGKVCVPGSVMAPELFRVESYRNVHHLVSTITGTLDAGKGIPELIDACFPGGSITGAPKRRAMEIIEALEPYPRNMYCGTIFWATADGRFGSNIAIRTFVVHDGVMYGWAGAGIVADSVPATEHQECLDKLAPLMRTLEDRFL